MHTILVVDDDFEIREMLEMILLKEGYKVYTASNGQEGVDKAYKYHPDLVLLDVMMPEMDGIEACQMMRKNTLNKEMIIAFLSARMEDYSQVAGFNIGADDYIGKPIRPRVLLARIEALLRRKSTFNAKEEYVENSDLIIDRDRFQIVLKGKSIILPKKEFELLELLAKKPEKVFTRTFILTTVWGEDTYIGERTIDVHIRKLRKKLGDSYIRTIKGVGYSFHKI